MKIRNKLLILTGLFASNLAAFWFVTDQSLSRVRVGSPAYQSIIDGKDLLADVLPPPLYIIESLMIIHEMEDEERPSHLAEMEKTLARLEQEFDSRLEYWAGPLPEGTLKDAILKDASEPAREFFTIVRDEFLPAVREGKREEASAIVHGSLKGAFDRQRAAVVRVVDLSKQFAAQGEADAQQSVAFWSRIAMTVGAGIALVVCAASFLIARSITQPMRRVIDAMRDIAQGEGDLTKRLAVKSNDETGELAQWFDQFVERMHDTIVKVSQTAWTVADSAQRIAAASEQAASNTQAQTQQVESMSGAIEQMSMATDDIAKKSGQASSIASGAGVRAQEGGEVVKSTVGGIRSISTLVKESATVIEQLGNRSNEIGQIVEVINDIADQTNLLALNAAIEAARAGEHGRGFAVVADEVRKLADRTTKATAEIASSIKTIQTDTSSAVERFAHTAVKVDEAVGLAEKSGQVLDLICESTSQVSGTIESIAAATEEQNAAARSVRDGITMIATSTSETAQGAAEAARSACTLSQKSSELTDLVGGFKLDMPTSADGTQAKASPGARGRGGSAEDARGSRPTH